MMWPQFPTGILLFCFLAVMESRAIPLSGKVVEQEVPGGAELDDAVTLASEGDNNTENERSVPVHTCVSHLLVEIETDTNAEHEEVPHKVTFEKSNGCAEDSNKDNNGEGGNEDDAEEEEEQEQEEEDDDNGSDSKSDRGSNNDEGGNEDDGEDDGEDDDDDDDVSEDDDAKDDNDNEDHDDNEDDDDDDDDN